MCGENPSRRLRLIALSDRVGMGIDRASFDDLVTLVTQAPPWEKDRLPGVRVLLRGIGEGKVDARGQILARWTWKLARATRKVQDRRASLQFPEAKRLLGALAPADTATRRTPRNSLLPPSSNHSTSASRSSPRPTATPSARTTPWRGARTHRSARGGGEQAQQPPLLLPSGKCARRRKRRKKKQGRCQQPPGSIQEAVSEQETPAKAQAADQPDTSDAELAEPPKRSPLRHRGSGALNPA